MLPKSASLRFVFAPAVTDRTRQAARFVRGDTSSPRRYLPGLPLHCRMSTVTPISIPAPDEIRTGLAG